MKKIVLYLLVLGMSISVIGCTAPKSSGTEQTAAGMVTGGIVQDTTHAAEVLQNEEDTIAATTSLTTAGTDISDETADESAVRSLVKEFGKRLQAVSLLSPKKLLDASLQENYGGLVSPGLITEWQSNPHKAPGRMVSSPWPDRIEISVVIKSPEPENTYEVKGEIIEITSVEKENGEAAAKRPVRLLAAKAGDRWQIISVTLGEYEDKEQIIYENVQYGFKFSLPDSWKGYTIITDKWEGRAIDGKQAGNVVQTGPILSVRHPEWTSQNPRQDIPIMIFTPDQWKALLKDEYSVSAAPIRPGELGRNSAYVFALPARYNFAFPAGYEEVEKILNGDPLKPQEPDSQINR